MGTKLHSKPFFPGYSSKGDANSVNNGMWALYDEDRTSQRGQLKHSFLANSTMDRYIGYEKEKVRQTILKHELTFRDQLQELHRLYKRQRDLMNEFGRGKSHKHVLPAETSEPSLMIPQTPLKDANDISSVSDSFMVKGKSTCSRLVSYDKTHSKNHEFVKPENKLNWKMFDLELPAEVYMKDEEKQQEDRIYGAEGFETCTLENNNKSLSNLDMNLCPGSVCNSQSNEHGLNYKLNSTRNHNLADLNEPWVEETSTRDPTRNLGKRDICGSVDRRSQSQSKEVYQSCLIEKDGRSHPNNTKLESVIYGYGHSTHNSKAGQTRFDDLNSLGNVVDESPFRPFRSLHVGPKKNLCDQSNPAFQRIRTIFGGEISDSNQNRSTDTWNSPNLRTLIQHTDAVASEPSCIVPSRKTCNDLTQNVVLTRDKNGHRTSSPFTGRTSNSAVQFPEFSRDESSNNIRPVSGLKLEASNKSSLCFGSQSSGIHNGYVDINSYIAAANKLQNKVVLQENSVVADTKMHQGDKQITSREVLYQMSLESLQNHSQNLFNKAEIAKDPFKNFTSPCGFDSGRKVADVCHSNSSCKILGIPIVNVRRTSEALISPNCPSIPAHNASRLDSDGASKDYDHTTKFVNKLEEKNPVADNGIHNNFSGLRHVIDLNVTPSEEETTSLPSVPITISKIAAREIDLEVPATLESVKDVSSEADLQKKDKTFTKGSLEDYSEHYEELSKVAAETMIVISRSQSEVIEPSCQSHEALHSDCLLWLADIISTHEGNAHESKVAKSSTNVEDASCEEHVPPGMDYFEYMTLKLQDTKVEEYCQPCILYDCDNEDTRATSVGKSGRKGQARRGRQRRDFQRDILPGLVSLSRREVSEDLQTIEGMLKASGHTWQSSFSHGRAARNGRGRKRLGNFAPSQTTTAAAVCTPPIQQPICRNSEVEDRNLTGWGKRTRRLPRQRCLVGNHTSILNC